MASTATIFTECPDVCHVHFLQYGICSISDTASAASCSDGIKHSKQQQHTLEDKDDIVRVATQFKQEYDDEVERLKK